MFKRLPPPDPLKRPTVGSARLGQIANFDRFFFEQGAVHLSCDTKLTRTRPPPPLVIQSDFSLPPSPHPPIMIGLSIPL